MKIQHAIVDKLNRYLEMNQRSISLKYGYCHGLTLLWLLKVSLGEEGDFYHLINHLLCCETEEQFAEISQALEKLIAEMEWLQNSKKYLYNTNQRAIANLLDFQNVQTLYLTLLHNELELLLTIILVKGQLICLFCPYHTIGMVRQNEGVYLFNVNNSSIKPTLITSMQTLKFEIIQHLFRRTYFPSCRVPIGLALLSCRNNALTHLITQALAIFKNEAISTSVKDKIPGYHFANNLHLACRVGDLSSVEMLLENHANVDSWCNGYTPLLIASRNGNASLVRLLLKFGATPALANKKGKTPLDKAIKAGHEEVVSLLLPKVPGT